MTADERYETGLATRRSALGDAWVDRVLANRNSFNGDFQDLITRVVWGEIWTRPGLDRRSRRHVVIASLLALGQWDEFKLHVGAALDDGVTADELKEIILQCALYCGVPAANHATGVAQQALAERGLLPGGGRKTALVPLGGTEPAAGLWAKLLRSIGLRSA